MLFVVYNYNFITKFVLILPVFYYYVTPNFFYSPPTFGLPCINYKRAQKYGILYPRKANIRAGMTEID